MAEQKKVKIAAVGDLHVGLKPSGEFSKLFNEISKKAEVLLLCGDLTDYGRLEEAKTLSKELSTLSIPVIGVLGNHDYESGQEEKIKQILSQTMTVLDGHSLERNGIGFAGVKGFGGGFGSHMLGFFGEFAIKDFVRESINEALRLETALSQLHNKKKVVLMHYSPISETIEGEPVEIYPFLGSSRLEEPINLLEVRAVFHGHSHYGKTEGRTLKNIPVYNVSYPLLKVKTPKQPFLVIEI